MNRLDAELIALADLVEWVPQESVVPVTGEQLQRIHDLISEARDCIEVLARDAGKLDQKLSRVEAALDGLPPANALEDWREMVPERFLSLVGEPKRTEEVEDERDD